MMKIAIAAAAAGILALSGTASANENTQGNREAVSVQVDTAGVDFADPAAVAQFRRSVERQIEAICNPGDRLGADMKPDFKCRREMAATLEPTVTRLAARATQNDRRFVGVE
ncbi:UrcA family protein [Alteraurantiacibacter palmitatis]|uniref:UrcA family protein n=1 Tax=Alteraurantiacibacter palmitatis TaxID=2054628 RepID=A0ABV7E879_9SPHN